MELGPHEELQLLGLLLAGGALLVLAPTLRIPYPILLVLGGLVLGFMPGLPDVTLPPDLVLVAILPPLLYSAAFFTSLRELRANVASIGLLAVGVVAATTVGVAVVAHEVVDELTWPAAFVLGAVVSPTDPIAATAIARRLRVPRRLVTVIEGEALVNDASALVLYRTAVVAAVAGSFSLVEAGGRLVLSAAGGIAIGLAVGYGIRQVRKRLDHSPTEITIALLTGYVAYLPAEAVGASAVLAAVTAGIYMGWYTPELTTPETRLQGGAFWTILTFVVNAVLFGLVGLQLPGIVDGLSGFTARELALAAVAVCAAVIVIRFVCVFAVTYLARLVRREQSPSPWWHVATLVSWVGMRGAVSLAAALAIPLTTDSGAPFPQRGLIVFLAFTVILVTLVGQGLALPSLIERLRLEDDGLEEREEAKARIYAAKAALDRIDQLEGEDWVRTDTAERMRGLYRFRRDRFIERKDGAGTIEEQSVAYQRLRREVLAAEEQAVVALRNEGGIADDVMHRVLRDIALETTRLDAG
jgi:CPA1 family monovalent cation:H+ antiporter